jgi:hypothetical protein
MGVAILAASPAYSGNPLTIYENGTGFFTKTPVASTPIAGGGVDFFDPDFLYGTFGDFLIYEPDGVTPGDLVRFVPDASSCTYCADIEYYVLSGGSLEADVTRLPSYGALLGTAREGAYAAGEWSFSNGDAVEGYATHIAISAVPEPSTWLLMIAGCAGLGFASRRPRALATDMC